MDVFALNSTRDFGLKIAAELKIDLAPHEEREFEDEEHKARPLVSVRGHNVYVIQSLHSGPAASANDKLCRLLFFIGALKENGARRVTAVIPYLAYARKDRQTKPRDPVTTRYLALLLEAAGADLVMTLEVPQYRGVSERLPLPDDPPRSAKAFCPGGTWPHRRFIRGRCLS